MPLRARYGVANAKPHALADEQPYGRAHAHGESDADRHANPDRHA